MSLSETEVTTLCDLKLKIFLGNSFANDQKHFNRLFLKILDNTSRLGLHKLCAEFQQKLCAVAKVGLNRDLNPGPLAPKARIIPLDH